MASGLVPITSLTSAKRSTPPSSARENCLRYGRNSTEIVGVGLQLHPDRRRRNDVVLETVLVAISNRRILGSEGHPDLGIGVARAVPAGQRIRPQRLLPLELQQPQAGVGLARLRRLALELGYACGRHGVALANGA